MDAENPTLKWALSGVGVVVVCFCLGYFVFGAQPIAGSEAVVAASPTPAPPANLPVTVVENPELKVEDITAEKEAERKRAEAAKKAKEAARLKAEEEARLKAEEAKLLEPTPEPETVEPPQEKQPLPESTPPPTEEATKGEPERAKPTEGEGEGATEPEKRKEQEGEDAKPEKSKPEKAEKKEKSDADKVAKSLYRVRVGDAKTSREEAERLVAELRGRGYTPTIIADQRKGKTVFHVQTGAFADADGAERRKKELENNGYDVSVH